MTTYCLSGRSGRAATGLGGPSETALENHNNLMYFIVLLDFVTSLFTAGGSIRPTSISSLAGSSHHFDANTPRRHQTSETIPGYLARWCRD